jgi:hypothetical protein
MEYVENVVNLAQDHIGASLVMLKDLRMILKIGLVEIKMSMNLYNIHNLMLHTVQNALNGYLLKIYRMLLISLEVVLVKFIRLNGLKDILWNGILKTKNGKDNQQNHGQSH